MALVTPKLPPLLFCDGGILILVGLVLGLEAPFEGDPKFPTLLNPPLKLPLLSPLNPMLLSLNQPVLLLLMLLELNPTLLPLKPALLLFVNCRLFPPNPMLLFPLNPAFDGVFDGVIGCGS